MISKNFKFVKTFFDIEVKTYVKPTTFSTSLVENH